MFSSNYQSKHAAKKYYANVLPSSSIHINLTMETMLSSEMSVLTKAARRNILEDGILTHLISAKSTNVRLDLPNGPFPSDFTTNNL
jgi:hypothetical protein